MTTKISSFEEAEAYYEWQHKKAEYFGKVLPLGGKICHLDGSYELHLFNLPLVTFYSNGEIGIIISEQPHACNGEACTFINYFVRDLGFQVNYARPELIEVSRNLPHYTELRFDLKTKQNETYRKGPITLRFNADHDLLNLDQSFRICSVEEAKLTKIREAVEPFVLWASAIHRMSIDIKPPKNKPSYLPLIRNPHNVLKFDHYYNLWLGLGTDEFVLDIYRDCKAIGKLP